MIDVKTFFSKTGPPRFNELVINPPQTELINQPVEYRFIDKWIQVSPETVAIIDILVSDMMGDGFSFEGKPSAVKAARSFAEDNFFKEELKKVLWDWFVYGDGYLWKGMVEKDDVQKIDPLADEDVLRLVRHVPTGTMNIFLNQEKTEIALFKQITRDQFVTTWKPKMIIHGKFITLRGKMYGFSPLAASLVEVQTIGFIKDYAGNFFKNGGTPDFLFNLQKENVGSANFKYLDELLRKYKPVSGKHGNMVLAGEVKVERLNDFSKDMEFRQLAIYLTGVIAFSYGMPVSKIAPILGTEVKISSGADDLADAAYWRKISVHQDYWESLVNTQLFIPFFGAKFNFSRGYKQDEVRETQIMMQKVSALGSANNEFGRYGFHLSDEFVNKFFGLEPKDIKQGTLKPVLGTGLGRQMSNADMLDGPAKQKEKDAKRSQVSSTQDTSGV